MRMKVNTTLTGWYRSLFMHELVQRRRRSKSYYLSNKKTCSSYGTFVDSWTYR